MKPTLLWISPQIVSELEAEARNRYPLETGGVLLGFIDASDAHSVKVTSWIGPGPKAVHRRRRFEPDSNWQTDRIASAYGDSGRITTYLGDWHSHPGGSARPSRLDSKTARAISRSRPARVPHPLMVIMWDESEQWRVNAYRLHWRRLRPAKILKTP